MTQNKRFATWLAGARTKAELTQAQLAERLGVQQPTIGYWEDEGRMSMEPEMVHNLAIHLRVDPTEVAAALGYPVRPRQSATMPMTQDAWFERVSDLNSRLEAAQVQTVKKWADEVMPGEDTAGRKPNGRIG
jgi:DNA-binding XRE family transcriptional regulator